MYATSLVIFKAPNALENIGSLQDELSKIKERL